MALAVPHTDFKVEVSRKALGRNLPQRVGAALWAPMLAMAIMAFPLALTLGAIQSHLVYDHSRAATAAALGQGATAAIFLGFATVYAAVAFAIARILGELRTGGGSVQEVARRAVHTLKMPLTGKIFLGLMMMGMMVLLFTAIAHAVLAGTLYTAINNGDAGTITLIQRWATWLGGLQIVGIVTYILSISFGLATIVNVLRFQTVRISELPSEPES